MGNSRSAIAISETRPYLELLIAKIWSHVAGVEVDIENAQGSADFRHRDGWVEGVHQNIDEEVREPIEEVCPGHCGSGGTLYEELCRTREGEGEGF